jgi:hypothetical protein
MSTANAHNGSAIKPRPAPAKTASAVALRPAQVPALDQGPILAQIPDLDPKAVPTVPAKRSDGRILSQAMSIKLIFGVGFGLVIGAILPFVFSRGSRPEAKPLPEWTKHDSPTVAGNTAQAATTWPTASPAVASNTSYPARTAEIVLPKPQQPGDARPAGLSDPAWPQSHSPAATTAYNPPPPANFGVPPSRPNPPDYRNYDRPATPAAQQADRRSDPAMSAVNGPGYDYRGNPVAAPLRDAPGNLVPHDNSRPGDNRYDNGGSYPSAAGGALMPSGGANGYRDQQFSEPSVARFDGSITPPPAR